MGASPPASPGVPQPPHALTHAPGRALALRFGSACRRRASGQSDSNGSDQRLAAATGDRAARSNIAGNFGYVRPEKRTVGRQCCSAEHLAHALQACPRTAINSQRSPPAATRGPEALPRRRHLGGTPIGGVKRTVRQAASPAALEGADRHVQPRAFAFAGEDFRHHGPSSGRATAGSDGSGSHGGPLELPPARADSGPPDRHHRR